MSDKTRDLKIQLAAAQKTISVLMEQVEHAIDAAGSLHNLFQNNIQLEKAINEHIRNERELEQFNRSLEELVAQRTLELKDANNQLNQRNAHLKELIRRDGLTCLLNHSAMIDIINQRIAEARRYQIGLAVIMFDIDYFKKVNDTYGHQFGDHVLRIVSKVLKDSTRAVDYASRFGGEEFVVLVSNREAEGADTTADRIRQTIADLNWKYEELKLTISAGVAHFREADSTEKILARADKRLYFAKKGGRNRVVMRG